MPLPPRRLLRTATALTTLTLLLSGCWMFGGGDQADDGPVELDCEWIGESTSETEPGAETVVMVDLSASTWTSDTGQIPDHARIVRELALEHFQSDGVRTFTLGLFAGDASDIRFPVQHAPLARPLDQEQDEQVDEIGACVTATLEEAMTGATLGEGSDVLAAVTAGARTLRGSATSTLAVVTDGHSNVGCLDLNRVLADPDPTALREQCDQLREWPAELPQDLDLRLVGVSGSGLNVVGDSSGAQTLGELREFWNRIGEELTGVAGQYTTDPAHAWVQAPDLDLPEDPPVIVRGSQGQPLVIDAEALFDTDSATLKESARSGITTVLDGYGDLLDRSLPVTVTGHTDSRGAKKHNDDLSERRAAAVRDHLSTLGFTEVSADGRGSDEPVCDDSPGETFDEACGSLNRRVEILFDQV